MSRLKQGSTLSIQCHVPVTRLVLRSAWRDDGHVELTQVLSSTDGTESSVASPPSSVNMSVIQHKPKATSLGRLEPHMSITLNHEESPDSPKESPGDKVTKDTAHRPPPLPFVKTVSDKTDIDRVMMDDGTIHPISDPEIATQLQEESDTTNEHHPFRRTDYHDGIAHMESVSSSEQTQVSSSSSSSFVKDPIDDEEGDQVGTFLSLDVPEKLNVQCHLHQGGSVHVSHKLEGDVTLYTRQGDVEVTKIRGHEIHLETKQGSICSADVLEAQRISLQSNHGRIRAKQIFGTSVEAHVQGDNTTKNNSTQLDSPSSRFLKDSDDEGSLIDVSALYVAGEGGATLQVSQVQPLARRAVRVKTIHGPIRVETNHVSIPSQYNDMLVPPERYPLVELGGVNGNCEVDISDVDMTPSGAALESWASCVVHVDSLAPESVSLIAAHEGTVRLTVDRKAEADLRFLSLPQSCTPQHVTDTTTLLAEEENAQTVIENLKTELSDTESTANKGDNKISIETLAFTPNPAASHSGSNLQYMEGWIENKSAEPDSRFERKVQGEGGGGKIRIDQAAFQALQGFQPTDSTTRASANKDSTTNDSDKDKHSDPTSSVLRPLFVAVGRAKIQLETLSWVGAIARRYGMDDGNRGLGRTATRRGRGFQAMDDPGIPQ